MINQPRYNVCLSFALIISISACSNFHSINTPLQVEMVTTEVFTTPNKHTVEEQSITKNPTQSIDSTVTLIPIEEKIIDYQVSAIDGMKMVFVPKGEFLMGSEDGVGDSDEEPQHHVSLTGFWIDQIEITNAMYKQCVDALVCSPPHSNNSYSHNNYHTSPEFSHYPVVNVDWYQATKYCKWVGRRLPTEAEWEMAARGTDNLIYPWGNELPDSTRTNYAYHNTDTVITGYYLSGSSPYGVLDMAGNVAEWVSDWYGIYPIYTDPNPQGPTMGQYRILRGGSWIMSEYMIRSAERYWASAYFYDEDTGFRCAFSD